MPYTMCVISGVVAGVISMAVLMHTETPRSTPMPLDGVPMGTSLASPQTVTLDHNANVMFDNVRPEVSRSTVSAGDFGVTLPIGERVLVKYGNSTEYRIGTLEAADDRWLQLFLHGSQKRLWISRGTVTTLEPVSQAAQETD